MKEQDAAHVAAGVNPSGVSQAGRSDAPIGVAQGVGSQPIQRRNQRSVRNYVLDPRFQFKFTGLLVAVAVLLSAVLGVLLLRTSDELVEQSRVVVEQGREAVRLGQATIVESQKVSAVVAMTIDREYAADPALAEIFRVNEANEASPMEDEQRKLEQAARDLEAHAGQLVRQQRRTLRVLLVCLALFVSVVAAVGIVLTHKVAGPVYKMTMMLNGVARGELVVRSGLRRGDELTGFFAAFRAMVESLKARHVDTMNQIERSIADLREVVPAERLASLEKLHSEMTMRLGGG